MEPEQLDQKTRKLTTRYVSQDPKTYIDRLYFQRYEGRRGLIGLEDCLQVEVHGLKKYYLHKPEKVLESEGCNILWDFPINTLEHNRLNITVIDKKSKKFLLIDLAFPSHTFIEKTQEEKCTNYSELKYEIARIWKVRKVEGLPVVIGALGTVTKAFEKRIEKLDFDLTIEALQKPCLFRASRIIWKVLDMK